MTVIAYKAGRMACDALCVDMDTGTYHSKANKIKRTKAGALIGQSGDADCRALMALMDNIKSGAKMPSSKELAATECYGSFLCVFPAGDVWTIDIYTMADPDQWCAQACPVTGMHSIASAGCGGDLATAFMRAGKSARQAVASVCEINAFCAPPIYEEDLKVTRVPRSTSSGKPLRKART